MNKAELIKAVASDADISSADAARGGRQRVRRHY